LQYLTRLQWLILEESKYSTVRTWKFPFDAWVYLEILAEDPPDVLVEVGNRFGGSALMFAHLFDQLGVDTRIIAVDIDHSELHPLPLAHPRITWVEGDALEVFPRVQSLITQFDSVMVIEDASHTYHHTLEIMNLYGSVVTEGQMMIIEDTILHHGVTNALFDDPGAFASVETFLASEQGAGWRQEREWERFIVTWNPSGFLRKVNSADRGDGHCGGSSSSGWDVERVRGAPRDWYKTDNLVPKTMNLNGIEVTMTPPPATAEGITPRSVFGHCSAQLKEFGVPDSHLELFSGLCLGKILGGDLRNGEITLPKSSESSHEDLSAKLTLPLPPHGSRAATEDFASTVKSKILSGPGLAVIPSVLSNAITDAIRAKITTHPEFLSLRVESGSQGGGGTRYLHPLCENESKASDCKIWGDEFLELLTHPAILPAVRSILGPSAIVDNTALSITWPGHNTFGPHRDRPFDANSVNAEGNGDLPPKGYPVSLQVVWTFDLFTTSNGGFFYVPGNFGTEKGQDGGIEVEDHVVPPNALFVTTGPGSALIANGALLHGAGPNFSPRPRVALLVQYTRRFVGRFHLYGDFILSNLHAKFEAERMKDIEMLLGVKKESSAAAIVQPVFLPASSNIHLPRSGELTMPLLAFGTGSKFTSLSEEETAREVYEAILVGYRHFDLAEMYGNCREVGIGLNRAISSNVVKREELWITHKLWATNMDPKHVGDAVENMLQLIGMDYLDMLLIHWPVPLSHTGSVLHPSQGITHPVDEFGRFGYPSHYSVLDTWHSLEEEVMSTRRRVMNIGLSNAGSQTIHEIMTRRKYKDIPIACNQIEQHVMLPQHELIRYSESLGILTVVYGVLGGGGLLHNQAVTSLAEEKHCKGGAVGLLFQFVDLTRVGVVMGQGGGRQGGGDNFERYEKRAVKSIEEDCGKLTEDDWRELRKKLGGSKDSVHRFVKPKQFQHLFANDNLII